MATAGPMERAGFIDAPVMGPITRPITMTVAPIATAASAPCALLSVATAITTSISTTVMTTSIATAVPLPTVLGRVRDRPLSSVNSPATAIAPHMAPVICATQYGMTSRHGKCRPLANASVTAGLMWAPERCPMENTTTATMSPHATAVPTWPPSTPCRR